MCLSNRSFLVSCRDDRHHCPQRGRRRHREERGRAAGEWDGRALALPPGDPRQFLRGCTYGLSPSHFAGEGWCLLSVRVSGPMYRKRWYERDPRGFREGTAGRRRAQRQSRLDTDGRPHATRKRGQSQREGTAPGQGVARTVRRNETQGQSAGTVSEQGRTGKGGAQGRTRRREAVPASAVSFPAAARTPPSCSTGCPPTPTSPSP